jgi:hypothetical protein
MEQADVHRPHLTQLAERYGMSKVRPRVAGGAAFNDVVRRAMSCAGKIR